MKPSYLLFLGALPVCSLHAEEAVLLPEVTVKARGSELAERRDASTQKVVVGRKEIEDSGAMTVGEVLGKLPGVELNANGGGPRARGMTRDSVQILVDGERLAGSSYIVSAIMGRLPAGDLERVEILRGASAEFGGAASVTVNLVMKKALPKRTTELKAALGARGAEPNAQFSWKENGGEGSYAWSLPVTLNLNRMPISSVVERRDAVAGVPALWQTEHTQGVSTFREFVLAPRLSWKSQGDSLTLSPLLFNGLGQTRNDTQLYAYANPAAATGLAPNGDRSSREQMQRTLLRLRAEGETHLGENKLSGRAALNQGKRDSDATRLVHDAAGVATSSNEQSRSADNEASFALRLDQSAGDHLLAYGVEYINLGRQDTQSFSALPAASANTSARERDAVLWVQDDWMLNPAVTLTYGVRGENAQLQSETVQQQHARWMPSLAARWQAAPAWVVRSSVGAGMKMPRLNEISAAAAPSVLVNTPVQPDQRGNPALQPERSVNFEAVLERYLDDEAGVLAANLYVRSTANFVEQRVQREGVRWVERPYNEGAALHWGWELDGKARMEGWGWKGATLKAHLTLPHARVDDTRLGISRMARDTPRYVFSTGLDQSLPAWDSSYGVTLQVSGRSVTSVPGEQAVWTAARTQLDAFWLYKMNNHFNLRCSGQNLLNEKTVRQNRYRVAGDSWQSNNTDFGYRTVLFTLEGRW